MLYLGEIALDQGDPQGAAELFEEAAEEGRDAGRTALSPGPRALLDEHKSRLKRT